MCPLDLGDRVFPLLYLILIHMCIWQSEAPLFWCELLVDCEIDLLLHVADKNLCFAIAVVSCSSPLLLRPRQDWTRA